MSINARQIQTCSYCDEPGHKADKCSCPTLMELFVRTVEFVQAIRAPQPSLEEQTAVWLNTQPPRKIEVLARNLKLTQNIVAPYNEARTRLIRHITQRRYSQDEVEFANRVSFRVGENADIMTEYRRIPQPPSLSEYRVNARIAVHSTRENILRMTMDDRRRFLVELNNAQENVELIERFMEIYSGHRFQTGNFIIANYYVNMLASTVVQLRRHPPTDWEGYLRGQVQQNNAQRRQARAQEAAQLHPRNVQAPHQAPQQVQEPQGPPRLRRVQDPHQGPPPPQQRPFPRVFPRDIPQPQQIIRNKATVVKVASFVMPFDCPICYEPVVEKCIVTTCGHQYCTGCFEGVSNMFDRHTGNNTCSMCRGVLSSVVECIVVEQSLASWMELKK